MNHTVQGFQQNNNLTGYFFLSIKTLQFHSAYWDKLALTAIIDAAGNSSMTNELKSGQNDS